MNIQEYISGGMIESYVLGLLSEEEVLEFDRLAILHPELAKARDEFERALELTAMQGAVAPPAMLKEKLLGQLTPGPVGKLRSMQETHRVVPAWRWMAAASILLFLVAGFFAWEFYKQNQSLRDNNLALRDRISEADSSMRKMDEEQRLMKDPNVTVVSLVGNQKANPTSAAIYWDTTSANVYMVVKNMPALPSEKQYQLWALLDGKPIDLGLFDGGQQRLILKMNNARRADAFAITIENRGNAGTPKGDMEAMKKL